jgi:hypothetical protein
MSNSNGSADPPVAAILYAAKSTKDERGSIPTQLEDARAAAEAEGREGREVDAEFSDEEASAFKGNRGDGLAAAKERAIAVAAEGRAVEIWVQHSDRLARGDGIEADHLAEVWFALRRHGVRLRSAQDDANLDDAIRVVLIGERNYEDSARKAAAVASGMRRAADRGEPPGGIVPDGYRVLRDVDERGRVSRRWVKDPDRFEIYELQFALALAGHSDREIVLELDRRGYRTKPRKRTHKPRPFDANRVRQTLANAAYAGLRVHCGEVIGKGDWPALVEPEDFYRLRRQRALRANQGPQPGRPPERYVLARVASCSCGAPMDVVTGSYARKDGSRARRYVCRIHRERPQDCGAQPIDAAVVDWAFVDNLTEFMGDVEAVRSKLAAGREAERVRLEGEVDRAEQALARQDAIIAKAGERYRDALAAGDDDRAATIEDELTVQRAERRRMEVRSAAASDAFANVADEDDVDPALDFFSDLRAELAGRIEGARGDVKRLNAAVQEFFERVELEAVPEGVRIRPVLSAVATQRIVADVERWPHPMRAKVGGRDFALDEPTQLTAAEFERVADELLEGGEVEVAIDDPPPLLAITAQKPSYPLR